MDWPLKYGRGGKIGFPQQYGPARVSVAGNHSRQGENCPRKQSWLTRGPYLVKVSGDQI